MNYLKTPWTSQPQQSVGIDWSNPITRGLEAVFTFTPSGATDLVSGKFYPSSNLTQKVTSRGVGVTHANATGIDLPGLFQKTSDFSRIVVCTPQTTGTGTLSDGKTTGFGGAQLQIGTTSVEFNRANEQNYLTISIPNRPFVIAVSAGANYQSGFVDGVLKAERSGTTTFSNTGTGRLFAAGPGSVDYDGTMLLHISYLRSISNAEAASLSANPWQIFKPIPRRIFVPVSAVSSDTLLYPSKGSLVTSGYTPTITQPGSNTTLSPSKGSLAITGKTPTLTQPNALSPSKAAAIFSGKQPTISQTANQTLSPSKVSLVFSGKTPTIDQTAANSILPGTGHYYTTGKTPTITQPNSLAPSKRAVALTGYQPTIQQSFSINPTTGAVVITGKTPSITQPNAITPLVAHAILTGKTPIISDSTPMTDSQKLDLIIDILSNKQTLNPTTGIYTLYADDGTTVLMTAQAWEDAAGTIPYRGKALQRLDAMS